MSRPTINFPDPYKTDGAFITVYVTEERIKRAGAAAVLVSVKEALKPEYRVKFTPRGTRLYHRDDPTDGVTLETSPAVRRFWSDFRNRRAGPFQFQIGIPLHMWSENCIRTM